jgi:hypothetical protein
VSLSSLLCKVPYSRKIQGQFPTPKKGSGETTRTKYGDIHDVEELAKQATANDMNLYFDAVLNHKAGADDTDECTARKVDINDRLKDISGDMKINGWFKFDFPGRLPNSPPEMSKMVWASQHFIRVTGTISARSRARSTVLWVAARALPMMLIARGATMVGASALRHSDKS